MNGHIRKGKRPVPDRLAGPLLTCLGAVLLGLGSWYWLNRGVAGQGPDPLHQERLAFDNLQVAARAMTLYGQKDWDRDGTLTHPDFLVHLWQSVDGEGAPIRVDLLSRRFAFAMVREFSLHGYWFPNLHYRQAGPGGQGKEGMGLRLDPRREWALAACPKYYGRSGFLTFITDGKGRIYAKDSRGEPPPMFPRDPAARGWHLLAGRAGLLELQAGRRRSTRRQGN